MGVSKKDWSDWHASHWTGAGSCSETYARLEAAFDGTLSSIEDLDADRFCAMVFVNLGSVDGDGELMTAVRAAAHAALDALTTLRDLKLTGSQRTFANGAAIEASDAAIAAVDSYNYALDILIGDLPRGCGTHYNNVRDDPDAISRVKKSDLGEKLSSFHSTIDNTYQYANAKVTVLTQIKKIGIV